MSETMSAADSNSNGGEGTAAVVRASVKLHIRWPERAANVIIRYSRASLPDASDEQGRRYAACSLLLQIGKVLGVQPSSAPSVFLSAILAEIAEKWSLRRGGQAIRHDEIRDGDKLELFCGSYWRDERSSAPSSEGNGVDLLALIPSRFSVISVSIDDACAPCEEKGTANSGAAKHVSKPVEGEGQSNKASSVHSHSGVKRSILEWQQIEAENRKRKRTQEDHGAPEERKRCEDDHEEREQREVEDDSCVDLCDDSDDESDIEDVTDAHVSKKTTAASPEIIDLQDVSSDDENDIGTESCFWEYDEFGEMKRSAASKQDTSTYSHGSAGDASVASVDCGSDSSSDVEDVTDIMLAKRKEEREKMMQDAEEVDDSDSSSDEGGGGKKKRKEARPMSAKRKRPKVTSSPIEVAMDEKDMPMCPGAKASQESSEGDSGESNPKSDEVDHSIKQRIVKLLNTGFHGESNEHEARNAMKLARRLMERYNLEEAMLLQERGDGSLNDFSTANGDDGSALRGGIVTVKIRHRKNSKALSSLPRWLDFLVQPVCLNFHVEAFKTVARSTARRVGTCSVTFYGIRTNAELAAYSFKVACERISLMAASYEPPRAGMLPPTKQVAETRSARLSYALGIVNGLRRDIEDGLRREEERRKADLRRAQRAAKDEGDQSDSCPRSRDDHGNTCTGGKNASISDDGATERLGNLERENTAHLALIDHHKKIATDVLKVGL